MDREHDDIPAAHWSGGALDCAGCGHAVLRAEGVASARP